jgi:hypothetical protein
LNDDKIINFTEYKKDKVKKLTIPTIGAFQPNQYYIHPETGTMIHVLFITDKSDLFRNEMCYVAEDSMGCIDITTVEDDTCEGWHELHKDVFIKEISEELPPVS